MSRVIILISGKAGVGKSTAANLMVQNLLGKADKLERVSNIGIYPFARRLKSICSTMFGWDGTKDERGRGLLIELARTIRNFDLNFWVRSAADEFNRYYNNIVIVDDWRYLNEYEYLKKNQGSDSVITVRVERPQNELLKSSSSYNDPSETSLPSVETSADYYDAIIYNSGDLQHLAEVVDVFIDRWIINGRPDSARGNTKG